MLPQDLEELIQCSTVCTSRERERGSEIEVLMRGVPHIRKIWTLHGHCSLELSVHKDLQFSFLPRSLGSMVDHTHTVLQTQQNERLIRLISPDHRDIPRPVE